MPDDVQDFLDSIPQTDEPCDDPFLADFDREGVTR